MSRRLPGSSRRFLFVDGLKALASVLIVLHHLAFYGPMADHAAALAPAVFGWLAHEARMVVQIFLVIGGYMAARSLAPHGRLVIGSVREALVQRASRLVIPYWFALALTLCATQLASHWMQHSSLSSAPTLGSVLVNALLMAQILGQDSISAGAWYVAIDLQLYGLVLLLFAGVRALSHHWRWETRTEIGVALASLGAWAVASMVYFNLDSSWDAWPHYFVGAYALGAAAWWCSDRQVSNRWFAMVFLTVGIALWWHWRDRLFLAALTAASLAWMRHRQQHGIKPWSNGLVMPTVPAVIERGIAHLGRTSYALFLAHFPVCLVVNAAFTAYAPHSAGWQALGVLCALGGSLAAAQVFHDWIEVPAQHLTHARAGAKSTGLTA